MIEAWLIQTNPDQSVAFGQLRQWCLQAGVGEMTLAGPQALSSFVENSGKRVLTFAGYSAAGYEDCELMYTTVSQALEQRDPKEWIIGIGATAEGIGAAYKLAKQLGFTTLGIVSSLALGADAELSEFVDYVFFVEDTTWGGRLNDRELSPTSQAIVEIGDEFIAIGGNSITRDELIIAQRAGKVITYIPAEMNHKIAKVRAKAEGLPLPTNFQGLAHSMLVEANFRPQTS